MSIEFCAVEYADLIDQTAEIGRLLNDGWQIVSSHVTFIKYSRDTIYTTFMQRDTKPNGLHTASALELLTKRVTAIEDWMEVFDSTLDDDSQPGDLAAPIEWARQQRFIPLAEVYGPPSNYQQVIEEALDEDAAQAGQQS